MVLHPSIIIITFINRGDFCDLITQLHSLLILYERVMMAKWLLKNAKITPNTISPDPVLEHIVKPYTKLPGIKVILRDDVFSIANPTAKDNTYGLIPPRDAFVFIYLLIRNF